MAFRQTHTATFSVTLPPSRVNATLSAYLLADQQLTRRPPMRGPLHGSILHDRFQLQRTSPWWSRTPPPLVNGWITVHPTHTTIQITATDTNSLFFVAIILVGLAIVVSGTAVLTPTIFPGPLWLLSGCVLLAAIVRRTLFLAEVTNEITQLRQFVVADHARAHDHGHPCAAEETAA